MQTRQPFLAWRGGVYDEKARIVRNKMGWNALAGLIGVQCKEEDLKPGGAS